MFLNFSHCDFLWRNESVRGHAAHTVNAHRDVLSCFHYLPAAVLFASIHEFKALFFNMCLLHWGDKKNMK